MSSHRHPSLFLRWKSYAYLGVLLLIAAIGIVTFLMGNNTPHLPYEYLRVGFSEERPYAYVDANGNVTGECPEELRAVMKRLGVDSLQWQLMEFGSLPTALQTKRIDVIATGMFISPQRTKTMAFSSPTLDIREACLLAPKGRFVNVLAYKDLLRYKPFEVAVVYGAIEHQRLLRAGLPEAAISSFPDVATALDALQRREVDCIALSNPTISELRARRRANSRMVDTLETIHLTGETFHGYVGFAFRPSDKATLHEVNNVLASFVGSPQHRAIMRRFGFSSSELPEERTLSDVLRSLDQSEGTATQ